MKSKWRHCRCWRRRRRWCRSINDAKKRFWKSGLFCPAGTLEMSFVKKILWTQFQSIKKPLILRQFVKWHLVKCQFVILQIFSPKDYLQNAVCQKTLSQMTLSQMTVCDITDIFPTDYLQNAVCQKTLCLVIVEFNFLTIGSIINKYFF